MTASIAVEPQYKRYFWPQLAALLLLFLLMPRAWAEGEKLRIGTTLHPYYSFVANIVADKAELVPLIAADSNPHNYSPQAADIRRLMTIDVLVVNGIGHDEWAFDILKAVNRGDELSLLYANDGVALIPIAGDSSQAKVVNPHTFISTTAAIQQIYTIAKGLGQLDPDNARFYRDNARRYATSLRRIKATYMAQLAEVDLSQFRCATMHGAYGYLMQEFGLQVAAVIEPRHGVQPNARQLAKTIDSIKAANVNVLFGEKYFAGKLSATIMKATGVQMYSFSHMSDGPYSADLFERETRANLDTLVAAVASVNAMDSRP